MNGEMQLPIHYQILVINGLLAYWTGPRCRLLIHRIPRHGIEALHVNTFRGTTRSVDTTITQLNTKAIRATTGSDVEILTGHFRDVFCGPATMSSSSTLTACFPGMGFIQRTHVKTAGAYFVQGCPHDSETSLSLLSRLVDLW